MSEVVDKVLVRLDRVKKTANGWNALCPAHDDTHPSLDIKETDDGKVLLTCRSGGCSAASICKAIGLELKDLFPADTTSNGRPKSPQIVATYDYTDEAGCLKYQSVRIEPGKDGDRKDFFNDDPTARADGSRISRACRGSCIDCRKSSTPTRQPLFGYPKGKKT